MLYRCLLYGYLSLSICWGCFIYGHLFTMSYVFLIYYQSVPHVGGEVFLCGPHFLLIISLWTLPLFLIVYRYIVDTVLYLYALLINYLLHPFSSLCLSCNLSQT